MTNKNIYNKYCFRFFSKRITIYFLDRNIISLIKEINSGKDISKQKQEVLNELEKIKNDINSRVTPIFSLIEGQTGHQENKDEINETRIKEIKELENFFGAKKVERYFNSNMLDDFYNFKQSPDHINDVKNKEKFLKEINGLIINKLKKEVMCKKREEILRKAWEFKIDRNDPIIKVALMCLYNNETCRKIIKPKKNEDEFKTYGAVLDLYHFTLFTYLSAYFKYSFKYEFKYYGYCHYRIYFKMKFLTDDRSLKEFFSWFDLENSSTCLNLEGEFIFKCPLSQKGIKNIPDDLKLYFDTK